MSLLLLLVGSEKMETVGVFFGLLASMVTLYGPVKRRVVKLWWRFKRRNSKDDFLKAIGGMREIREQEGNSTHWREIAHGSFSMSDYLERRRNSL